MIPRNPSRSFVEANPHLYGHPSEIQDTKFKLSFRDGTLAEGEREKQDSKRVLVRITSHRERLIDPDNLCPKYFIDCLRYAGIIADDSAAHIELSVSQRKCAKGQEETVIEIL